MFRALYLGSCSKIVCNQLLNISGSSQITIVALIKYSIEVSSYKCLFTNKRQYKLILETIASQPLSLVLFSYRLRLLKIKLPRLAYELELKNTSNSRRYICVFKLLTYKNKLYSSVENLIVLDKEGINLNLPREDLIQQLKESSLSQKVKSPIAASSLENLVEEHEHR